ncbi:MAG TPA: helix-turn-helix domain-containing protein, partial [Chloroflexota bacterium]|nr:helix-turn-helix domain-containing protein [Chloroflexota bacterium]
MAESRGRSFAQLLRQYRRDAGLTQEELAERASISVRAVSDLERGQRTRPRRDTVELLVSALALQPNDQAVLEACISRKRTTEKAALPKHAWGGLPAEITPLVGRELEEAGLIRLLTDRRARLITVTGPGGVGKTSLAIRVARTALQSRLARDFVFISLAPLRMASLVLPSLAAALDVPEGNRAELANAIARVIDGRDMLIVLDNFEHVQEAALDISNLLNTASDVTFLVTSREPLNLRGEHLFQLAPLSLPAQEESVTARDLPRYPALSLFLQRARAVQELDAPSDADAETVCAICRRIDGLPLAIELAAAQLRHVGPETLLQRLTGGMDALAAGPRDLPDRQQTMHDTIAWSYGLLNPGAKAVFRAASVLSGEFDAGAVRFLLSRSEAPSDNAMAEIEALCEKSLLLRNAMGKTGARFQ